MSAIGGTCVICEFGCNMWVANDYRMSDFTVLLQASLENSISFPWLELKFNMPWIELAKNLASCVNFQLRNLKWMIWCWSWSWRWNVVPQADCCSDPSDVFAFLEANDIGQDYALFYEAYATSMEVRRKFSTADEIYNLGLQRYN